METKCKLTLCGREAACPECPRSTKEKIYQLNGERMMMEEMNSEVWRFVQYYNRQRVCTFS